MIGRWNPTAVNTALQEEGFMVNQFSQRMAPMAAPVKQLMRAILSGYFRHGVSPLLRMCFGNVVGEKVAHENEKFTRVKARGRIDAAVAAAMAVGRIIANEVTVRNSVRKDPVGCGCRACGTNRRVADVQRASLYRTSSQE